jgi:CAAX protease family protein
MAVAVRPTRPGSAVGPSIGSFVREHPVLTYYALVFAISWGGVLAVLGPGGLPPTLEQWQGVAGIYMYLAIIAGPLAAGLLMTAAVGGRAGLRDLLARWVRWRVGARWYAVALLTAPLAAAASGLVHRLFVPGFTPSFFAAEDKASLLLFGVVIGLLVASCEETGWTGFVIPHLRARHGLVATGLVVGLLWGAWHFPAFWETGSFSGAFPLAVLVARLFAWLPAFRILMIWVYERTGSLLVPMLMHAVLVVVSVVFQPLPGGVWALTYPLGLAAALWLLVLVLACARARGARRTAAACPGA